MQATGELEADPKLDKRACRKCGSTDLRTLERLLPDLLFARQRYRCKKCSNRQSSIRFGFINVVQILLLLIIAGGGYYLQSHPFPFRSGDSAGGGGDDAESLARARSAMSGGQLSAFEKMMTRRPRSSLDNKAVIQLWRAQVPVNIILQMIRTSNADFDVSAASVIELRKEGLDPSVILAMIDASYTTR